MRKMLTLAAVLSAFALAVPAASAAGMSGKYCLKGPGSKMNCKYQTMASCTKAKKGTQTCVSSAASTTGAGMSHSKTKMKK
jgi:Protein of unknown function (DUF3551)